MVYAYWERAVLYLWDYLVFVFWWIGRKMTGGKDSSLDSGMRVIVNIFSHGINAKCSGYARNIYTKFHHRQLFKRIL